MLRSLCLTAACVAVSLAACSRDSALTVQRYTGATAPERLSDWNLIRRSGDSLVRAVDTEIYRIATPLFADYTSKLRTLSLPAGSSADYQASELLELPVGTIISKTFYYDPAQAPLTRTLERGAELFAAPGQRAPLNGLRLLETRLLVHEADGWHALPYVWLDDGSDAVLKPSGALLRIGDAPYVVPGTEDCATCHAQRDAAALRGSQGKLQPIGPKARHLGQSGLAALTARGWLTGAPADPPPGNATWEPALVPAQLDDDELLHRARSYLDANCGHCHNPYGNADTSSLMLDYAAHEPRVMGRCKPPIAAGKGTGGRLYSIVPGAPEQSIISYRMHSTDPGAMMPEIGRTQIHSEGVALVDEWIRRMDGECL